jgi:restriction endonuclease Mrr
MKAIEENGGKPFFDYQVPTAVLTLKQGFGRLIRSLEDRGVLVLLDPRVRTKRYGQTFLASLPPYRMTRRLPMWKSSLGNEASDAQVEDLGQESSLTPDEIMRNAHILLEQELADELLVKIHSGTPAFFENLVVRLLFAMGYGGSVTEINKALVGGTGDGGVDGVIDQDLLGLDRIYVQAKRYADGNNVGASSIREFLRESRPLQSK